MSLASLLLSSGELTDFRLSEEEVHGVYKTENGSLGIIFTSRIDFLHVETLTGKVLVHFGSFHEIDSKQRISRRSVYMLNQTYYQHKDEIHSDLDGPVYNNTKSFDDTLKEVLAITEINLLEGASHAVGELGVTGRNTPAVMPFFMFALRINQLLGSSADVTTDETQRPKRFYDSLRVFLDFYATTNFGLSPSLCNRHPIGRNCIGLCGRGCSCWRWVCGDCCFHKGCYDNDTCCERRGHNHPRCVIRPGSLSCDEPYRC